MGSDSILRSNCVLPDNSSNLCDGDIMEAFPRNTENSTTENLSGDDGIFLDLTWKVTYMSLCREIY